MKVNTFVNLCWGVLALMIIMQGVQLASAETYPVYNNVDLKFICTVNNAIPTSAATFNFSIDYPNGTSFINNQIATAKGQGLFNYTTRFPIVGVYTTHEFCYDTAGSNSNSETITVTTTGNDKFNWLPLYLLLGGIVLLLPALYFRNEYLGLFSGFFFIIAGIYLMIYGLGIIADTYTRMIAFICIGIGAILSFVASYEMFFIGGDKDDDD